MAFVIDRKVKASGEAASLENVSSSRQSIAQKLQISSLLNSPDSIFIASDSETHTNIILKKGDLVATIKFDPINPISPEISIVDRNNKIFLSEKQEALALKKAQNTISDSVRRDIKCLNRTLGNLIETGTAFSSDLILAELGNSHFLQDRDSKPNWYYKTEDYKETQAVSSINLTIGGITVKGIDYYPEKNGRECRIKIEIPIGLAKFLNLNDKKFETRGNSLIVGEFSSYFLSPIHLEVNEINRTLRNEILIASGVNLDEHKYLSTDYSPALKEALDHHLRVNPPLTNLEKIAKRFKAFSDKLTGDIASSTSEDRNNNSHSNYSKHRNEEKLDREFQEYRQKIRDRYPNQNIISKYFRKLSYEVSESASQQLAKIVQPIANLANKTSQYLRSVYQEYKNRRYINKSLLDLKSVSENFHIFYQRDEPQSKPYVTAIIAMNGSGIDSTTRQIGYLISNSDSKSHEVSFSDSLNLSSGKITLSKEKLLRPILRSISLINGDIESRISKVNSLLSGSKSIEELHEIYQILNSGVMFIEENPMGSSPVNFKLTNNSQDIVDITGRSMSLSAHRNDNGTWKVMIYGTQFRIDDFIASNGHSSPTVETAATFHLIGATKSKAANDFFDALLEAKRNGDEELATAV